MSSAASRTRLAVAALALVSVGALLKSSSGFDIAVLLFALWQQSPFFVTYRGIDETDSRASHVAAVVASLLPTLAYIALAIPLGRRSSTAGLGFAFFPFWHYLLIGVLLGVVTALDRWGRRARASES